MGTTSESKGCTGAVLLRKGNKDSLRALTGVRHIFEKVRVTLFSLRILFFDPPAYCFVKESRFKNLPFFPSPKKIIILRESGPLTLL